MALPQYSLAQLYKQSMGYMKYTGFCANYLRRCIADKKTRKEDMASNCEHWAKKPQHFDTEAMDDEDRPDLKMFPRAVHDYVKIEGHHAETSSSGDSGEM